MESMKGSFKKKFKLLSVLAAILAFALCGASVSADVLKPTTDFYVNDDAGVLDADTEAYICDRNSYLFSSCGAQICVVTTRTIGDHDIEDYAYEMFNEWGIGSVERDNGVLLLLVTDDEYCWCVQGMGLEDTLPTSTITRILTDKMEDDFYGGDFDSGTRKTFDALFDALCGIYSVDPNGSSDGTLGGGHNAAPIPGGGGTQNSGSSSWNGNWNNGWNSYEGLSCASCVTSCTSCTGAFSILVILFVVCLFIGIPIWIFAAIGRGVNVRRRGPRFYFQSHIPPIDRFGPRGPGGRRPPPPPHGGPRPPRNGGGFGGFGGGSHGGGFGGFGGGGSTRGGGGGFGGGSHGGGFHGGGGTRGGGGGFGKR